jgi:acetyl esterase/lipase
MEICNRHTDANLDESLQKYLQEAARDSAAWGKVVETFKAYPDEVFAAGCDYRAEIFAKWDRALQERHLTGIGANDAHQNTILKGVVFDPYEVSFRNLCTHILAREQTEDAIRTSLYDGHCYVSHDWLCDPTGFAFGAVNTLGVYTMGDTAPMARSTKVVGLTPLPAHLKLIHKGELVAETNGTNLTFTARKPGPYRLEAWLDVAGEERPWIYSNPVYLEEQSILSMRPPASAPATNVTQLGDIVYTDGQVEYEPKHKLDLYIPKGRERSPVFFFVHGGAWRSGDRSLYPPLGRRLSKEGIMTVIPSYRLAPKNPHPAQIEDVAAAFAWTVRHIGEHGGDTNWIYLGGHSAGGHLVALLALDKRYLETHQLSPAIIRGVVAMSGVYNLDIGESQSSVFGTERSARRNASPLFHIKTSAPSFLVTYCQWDYPTLPGQARQFHAALRDAGVQSELFFTPKENHISEMISFTYDDDVTVQRVVKFIGGPK